MKKILPILILIFALSLGCSNSNIYEPANSTGKGSSNVSVSNVSAVISNISENTTIHEGSNDSPIKNESPASMYNESNITSENFSNPLPNETKENKTTIQGLDFDNYTLVLEDLTVPRAGVSCASFGVYSSNGELLDQIQVCPNQNYYWVAPDGHRFRIIVYETSPGYTKQAMWASVAVFG